MSARGPLPGLADPGRAVPAGAGARRDHVAAALRTLGEETRRLERLGLADAAGRCRETRRYWGFVGALLDMVETPAPRRRGRLA